MICVKYRKDLLVLYGPVAHNIRKMIHVKYVQDQLALRPFRIHVNLNILKNFFMIPDTRVFKNSFSTFSDVRKDNDFSLSTHSLRTMVCVRKGVLYLLVKRCV